MPRNSQLAPSISTSSGFVADNEGDGDSRPDIAVPIQESYQRALQSVAGNPLAQKYLEAFARAQAEINKLKKELADLTHEHTELKLASTRKRRGPAKDKASSLTAEEQALRDYSRLAHYFFLFYGPFLPDEAFGKEKPAFRYNHPDRYLPQNVELGFTSDLYHVVPNTTAYYEAIRTSNIFRDTFTKGISEGMSNALSRIRRHCGELFDIPQQYFKTAKKSESPRTSLPKVRALLGLPPTVPPNGSPDVYPELDYPPILFPEGKAGNMRYVFMNPTLLDLARLVVYGDTFVAWTPESNTKLVMRQGGIYRHDDGRDIEATDGFIATIAIFARFVLGPDTEFGLKGNGNVSRIDWFREHAHYRQLLIKGRASSTNSILRIFELYNNGVFPNTRSIGEVVPDSEPEREALNRQARNDGGRPVDNLLAAMSLEDLDEEAEISNDDQDDIYGDEFPRAPEPASNIISNHSSTLSTRSEHASGTDSDSESERNNMISPSTRPPAQQFVSRQPIFRGETFIIPPDSDLYHHGTETGVASSQVVPSKSSSIHTTRQPSVDAPTSSARNKRTASTSGSAGSRAALSARPAVSATRINNVGVVHDATVTIDSADAVAAAQPQSISDAPPPPPARRTSGRTKVAQEAVAKAPVNKGKGRKH